jgi:hypothetical protein
VESVRASEGIKNRVEKAKLVPLSFVEESSERGPDGRRQTRSAEQDARGTSPICARIRGKTLT